MMLHRSADEIRGAGLVILMGFGLTGLGCLSPEGTSSAPREPLIHDSAGVRRVVNFVPQWDASEAWRVSPEPVLMLGREEGRPEEQFFLVRGATRLSDGRIVVLNGGSHELRFFEPDGGYAFSVGGAGDGPGEFRLPRHLERMNGDTLQITDGWVRIRYDNGGGLVAHERLPSERVLGLGGFRSEGCNVPSPLFLGTGILLCEGNNDVRDMPHEAGPWTLENLVVHAPWSLERVDTLRAFLGREAWVVVRGGRPWYVEPPLTAHGMFAVDGRQGRLAYANSHEYRIELYGLHSGSLEMLVERDGGVRAPTDSELEEAWASAERFLSRVGIGALRGELPVPDSVSEATRVHLDGSGFLWVRGADSPATDQVPYDIFTEDGILLGDLLLPARLTIVEIGVDYILGVETDVLGVERVVLYQLDREVPTSRSD